VRQDRALKKRTGTDDDTRATNQHCEHHSLPVPARWLVVRHTPLYLALCLETVEEEQKYADEDREGNELEDEPSEENLNVECQAVSDNTLLF
jgi:hypothetical protein